MTLTRWVLSDLRHGHNIFFFAATAADSDDEGELLATSLMQAFVALRSGAPGKLKPPLAGYADTLPLEFRAMLKAVLGSSAIGTLVERSTGYVLLVHLPDGYKPEQVAPALAAKIQTLPEAVRRDLEAWAGCIAGALEKGEYLETIRRAGFREVEVVGEWRYAAAELAGFGAGGIVSVQVRARR